MRVLEKSNITFCDWESKHNLYITITFKFVRLGMQHEINGNPKNTLTSNSIIMKWWNFSRTFSVLYSCTSYDVGVTEKIFIMRETTTWILKYFAFNAIMEKHHALFWDKNFKSNLIILFCLNVTLCNTSQYLEAIVRIFNWEIILNYLKYDKGFLPDIYSTRKSLLSFFKTNVDDFDY